MAIFGWIMLIILALSAIGITVLLVLPYIISEILTLRYKIERSIEDKRIDVDKRSEAKRHRDDIKRERDFELANKKLDAKLLKVDKKIKIQNEKLKLAEELKRQTTLEKQELNISTINTLAIDELISEESNNEEEYNN